MIPRHRRSLFKGYRIQLIQERLEKNLAKLLSVTGVRRINRGFGIVAQSVMPPTMY